jgi:hypothetical protein
MRLVFAGIALAIVSTLFALTSPAHAAGGGAVRLEAPTRKVAHVRVTYVQQTRTDRLWVEFNTGSLWSVRPCRVEDGNNCYWDARAHGNGKGRSFVTLRGKTYFSRLIRS